MTRRFGFAWLLLSLATPALADAPPPLSVRALFANPTISSPQLSPDGRHIAVVHSQGDLQHVAVRTSGSPQFELIVRIDDPDARLASVSFANEERLFVTATQRHPFAKDSRTGMVVRWNVLYGVSLKERVLRALYNQSFSNRLAWNQDEILHALPEDPRHVLVPYLPAHMRRPSVARLDVETGALEEIQRPAHGIVRWFADAEGRVRAGEGYRDDRFSLWARTSGDGEFSRVAERDALHEGGVHFAGFHDDPGKLYVRDDYEGRLAMFELDIASGTRGKLVFAHPEVDVDSIVVDPGPRTRPIGVRYTADRPEIHYFDAEAARERAALDLALERELGRPIRHRVVSATADGIQQLLAATSDTQPPSVFYYHRAERRLTRILDERPGVLPTQLSPTVRRTIQARDGIAIPTYLTLPQGVPAKKLPLIVMPHGGPWARDAIRWDPEVQLFASRGFAVLQPNYRGSSGFGRAHREAGNREWGQKIQDDITDAVQWAISEGIADADRIGIYGASFGGYATLAGLVKTPDLYRAGAAYASVTDIPRMLDDDEFYNWLADFHEAWVGGGRGDWDRLRATSPLRHAREIRAPVLLGHGEFDQRVRVQQSRLMANALRKAGKDVTYLEFPHEIHGFLLEANRIRWYEALIAFFEKNLAPRKASSGPRDTQPEGDRP